jgi:hypothetical protein
VARRAHRGNSQLAATLFDAGHLAAQEGGNFSVRASAQQLVVFRVPAVDLRVWHRQAQSETLEVNGVYSVTRARGDFLIPDLSYQPQLGRGPILEFDRSEGRNVQSDALVADLFSWASQPPGQLPIGVPTEHPDFACSPAARWSRQENPVLLAHGDNFLNRPLRASREDRIGYFAQLLDLTSRPWGILRGKILMTQGSGLTFRVSPLEANPKHALFRTRCPEGGYNQLQPP